MSSDSAHRPRFRGSSRGVALFAALAACLTAAFLAAGSARAAAPFGFIAMNAEDVYAGSDAYRDQMLSTMQSHGLTAVRQNFRWEYSEPAKGVYDWTALDAYVLAAAAHGMRVLPILFGEPSWATSRPANSSCDAAYPPARNADFGDWVGQVAGRYGRGGSFWSLYPQYAGQAITAYEIWNEPNLSQFWRCKPNAKAYVKLARAASDAIHAHDAKAYAVTAGSPQSHTKLGKYFNAALKAGAAKVFNAFALHTYEGTADAEIADMQQARRLLDQAGAKKAKMIVTEYGWATGGPNTKNRTVSESKQASYVRTTLTKAAKQRKKLKLYSMAYYTWRDLPPPPAQADYWGLHTGILRLDGTAKPALDAILQASHEIK